MSSWNFYPSTLTTDTLLEFGWGGYFIDASAGSLVLTLPDISSNSNIGEGLYVKRIDKSETVVTVVPFAGGQTIDGDFVSFLLTWDNAPLMIVGNDSQWYSVGRVSKTVGVQQTLNWVNDYTDSNGVVAIATSGLTSGIASLNPTVANGCTALQQGIDRLTCGISALGLLTGILSAPHPNAVNTGQLGLTGSTGGGVYMSSLFNIRFINAGSPPTFEGSNMTIQIGYGDNLGTLSGARNNGLYFQFDGTAGVDAPWSAVSTANKSGGTTETNVTSVALSDAFTTLGIEYNPSGTGSANFFINGVLVATNSTSTSIADTVPLTPFILFRHNSGITGSDFHLDIDYWRHEIVFTQSR
jgi:hypothetical protein